MPKFILFILLFLCIFPFCVAQVGIGTDEPTETLDVDGTMRVRDVQAMDASSIAISDSVMILSPSGVVMRVPSKLIVEKGLADGAGGGNIATESFSEGLSNPSVGSNETTGDTFLNTTTNTWFYFNGTDWLPISGISSDSNNILSIGSDGLPYLDSSSSGVNVNNGLSENNGVIQLGGNLIQPTTITTDSSNTLAIAGLETGNNTTDELVTINSTSGVLTKSSFSSFSKEYQVVHTASTGQTQFDTPAEITDINKVNVYRNGIRIGLSAIDSDTIQLETGVICYANDEIRIVQYN